MPGPVLGVDGIVLDGRVEPQAVALVAVVERRLERTDARLPAPATAASAATPRAALGTVLVLLVLVLRFLGALGLGRVELGGDQRVILGAEVDLVVEVGDGGTLDRRRRAPGPVRA